MSPVDAMGAKPVAASTLRLKAENEAAVRVWDSIAPSPLAFHLPVWVPFVFRGEISRSIARFVPSRLRHPMWLYEFEMVGQVLLTRGVDILTWRNTGPGGLTMLARAFEALENDPPVELVDPERAARRMAEAVLEFSTGSREAGMERLLTFARNAGDAGRPSHAAAFQIAADRVMAASRIDFPIVANS